MKWIYFFVFSICLINVLGCRSIHVGADGNIGGVYGSGGVDIPIPKK